MKIWVFLFFVFVSCRETAPTVVREYAPAQISIYDTTAHPVTITTGKCTTTIERNNIQRFTTVTTKSAPDTFNQIQPQPQPEQKNKIPSWWNEEYVIPGLVVLSALFVIELIGRIFYNRKK